MTCAEAEILICDYLDGTLPAAGKAELEKHLAGCAECAELARDARAAVSFMERAADVEPPPELLTRILFDAPWARAKKPGRNWMRNLLLPVLQPRFAMGMAMTILSMAMLVKFIGPIRPLKPADLNPVKVWARLSDKVDRGWERTVKFYENIRLVYQLQTRVREWREQQAEEQPAAAPEQDTAATPDGRRLPVKPPGEKK